jgi:tripartite-type tricarboxylate transporter receptor subunit TctC
MTSHTQKRTPGLVLCGALAALSTGLLSAPVLAQEKFPSRPMRMIVPFPPGGSNDILGRFLAQKMTDRLGQQVLVDNRAGADGIIGAEIASRSTPDGHTILIISTSYTQNPAIHKMPFDPAKALIAISQIATGAISFYVAPNSPITNIKELVALARSKPEAVRYATSGAGGVNHFAGELFNNMAGVKMGHVPYKGGGPSMVDVMSGRVEVGLGTVIQALPLLRSGKLRAIAVTTAKRSIALSDVPTIAESGVPGYDAGVYWGVLGPAGIPRPIVNQLNKEIGTILQDPETIKRLQNEAAEPVVSTPEAFQKLILTDMQKWIRVAKETGIKVE